MAKRWVVGSPWCSRGQDGRASVGLVYWLSLLLGGVVIGLGSIGDGGSRVLVQPERERGVLRPAEDVLVAHSTPCIQPVRIPCSN